MREGTVISCNIFQTFFILYSPVSTDGKQMLPLSRDFKPVMWIRIDCNADPDPNPESASAGGKKLEVNLQI